MHTWNDFATLKIPTLYKPCATKAIYQCIRSFKLEPRTENLNLVDLEITIRMVDATTRVYFADGKYVLVPMDSLTSIQELQDIIAQKLGIKDPSPFAIIETGDLIDTCILNIYVCMLSLCRCMS